MQPEPDNQTLDYRDLNRDLPVFASDQLIDSGLPLWLPAGAVIRRELEQLAWEIVRGDGCVSVPSPFLR
jgi:threonyl-tRNA synthetase